LKKSITTELQTTRKQQTHGPDKTLIMLLAP